MSAPDGVDATAVLRSRGYVRLLILTALVGAPLSAAAYGFLSLVSRLQTWLYDDLPHALGYADAPRWWPLPWLGLAGVLVSLAIRYLPGQGGHVPAQGFHTGAPPRPIELPGIALAALAGLGLGVVLGPEAPLIALGGGLAVLVLTLIRSSAPPQSVAVVGAAGSFAAVATLLGSPLVGAFMLMEASGLGGATMGVVLVPGLVAAGVGSLVFVGLGTWTGLGTLSLAIPDLPKLGAPTLAELGWAVVIGIAAAALGAAIRTVGLWLEPRVSRRLLVAAPLAGLVVAGLAIGYAVLTGQSTVDVLFSGQTQLGTLLSRAADYPAPTLVALLVAKALAYGICLAAFRGGPIFPAIFIGAAGGLLLGHVPGLPPLAGAAMGIGAMAASMLRLPLTAALLATLLFASSGLTVMPLVIVAVAVAHVATARFTPVARPDRPAPARTADG